MTNEPESTAGDALCQARTLLSEIIAREHLLHAQVSVRIKPLTPEEAIGTPERQDFPIIVGKERMIEASVLGSRGHAFTDSPRELTDSMAQVLVLDLDETPNRAIFMATLNATLMHLQRVTGTVHCKDEDPELCALEMAELLLHKYGPVEVGLVGLNPAIAERLVDAFGAEHTRITDLAQDNIGERRFGVEIWDGGQRTEELIDASDLLLVTGTTLVNGTFDTIHRLASEAHKQVIPYGVTASGVCELLGMERLCPRGQDG